MKVFRPHLPKVLRSPYIWTFKKVGKRALATIPRTFSRLHLPTVFWTCCCVYLVVCEIKFSLVHFLPAPSSKKRSAHPIFLKKSKVKSRSRFSHVPFLLPIFSRSNRAAMETETFFRRPQKSLYPKILHTFAPENLFKPGCTRSRKDTPPHYLMRMWLTWWCGWHNDWDDGMVAMMVRKLTIKIRIVRNSEVSWLNFPLTALSLFSPSIREKIASLFHQIFFRRRHVCERYVDDCAL